MPDREKVIADIEEQIAWIRDNDFHKFPGWGHAVLAMKEALALLKWQEEIVPYIDIDEAKCPICKVKLTRQELLGDDVLFEDFFDYCPHCGRLVKWE